MSPGPRNLLREAESLPELWSPRVLAQANGQYLKVARVQGEFVWHSHRGEDELFVVLRGRLTLRFRERPEVVLGPGDAFVVPRGVEHCPLAEEETWVMLLEPAATLHTGEVQSPLTRSIEEQLR
jgi:mannose-6-phosphate isomerase-like protein (cupin superfamily)